MLSPLQGAAIAFGCQNALLFGLIVFFHVGKWNALYTLAVCYRTIQASIAAVGICATTIPVISSRVNLTILMGASLLSEGCLELLAQYYLANRLFSEYRPAFWVVFVASCVHSLFAAILLPPRFQFIPFCVWYMADQAAQAFLWSYLGLTAFSTRLPIRGSPTLGVDHCLWATRRAIIFICLSIVALALSVTSATDLVSIIYGNLILLIPTPKAMIRFNRWRLHHLSESSDDEHGNSHGGAGDSEENIA